MRPSIPSVGHSAELAASGLRHGLLRNGGSTENHLAGLGPAQQHGALIAAAAAAVRVQPVGASRTIELAGDSAYTLAEPVTELNRQTGRAGVDQDLAPAAFEAALVAAGLPAPFAAPLVDATKAALAA